MWKRKHHFHNLAPYGMASPGQASNRRGECKFPGPSCSQTPAMEMGVGSALLPQPGS